MISLVIVVAGLQGGDNPIEGHRPFWGLPAEQKGNTHPWNKLATLGTIMVRLAYETMSLASVAGFVWMVCQAAHLIA